jgi:hypothetical protein
LNIDWVIPCRYVEVHDNLGTIVGAGIDTFWVPELPSPIQVLLAIRLLALADELDGEPHVATTRIRSPLGEVISEVGGEISAGAEAPNAEWLNGLMIAGVVQFEAAVEGRSPSTSRSMVRPSRYRSMSCRVCLLDMRRMSGRRGISPPV